jgi:HAD superfamily hydrolase (TIGR01549 family)
MERISQMWYYGPCNLNVIFATSAWLCRLKGEMIVAVPIRAVLFDLDDTLLANNMNRFLKGYFGLLAPHMARFAPPERFMPALLASTQAMIDNTDPAITNQQAFIADFFPRVGRTPEEMMPAFDEFYETQFGKLRELTQPVPEARVAIQAAFEADCDVVIATNPLFPERAIQHRIEWAGISDFSYQLITSYEVMHFCKPRPQYYTEIAKHLGRKPEECIMVGDDWENDIAPAQQAGLRVFSVNIAVLPPVHLNSIPRGTLTDFAALLSDHKAGSVL